MSKPVKLDLSKLKLIPRQRLSSLLGLTLDGSRLEGVVLKRANGSLQQLQTFTAALSLDLLTAEPALIGREIRNHLDAAGVRERRCVVGVPLPWLLTLQTAVPELPEEETTSFLQLEAERGFPSDVATLVVARSLHTTPGGGRHATLVGVPRDHVARLEQVLTAAQLKPISFALGIVALQPATSEASEGVLALVIGENHVALQITCGGGVAALRVLESGAETEAGPRVLPTEQLARDIRITLSQLPDDVRSAVRRLRVFGSRDGAQALAATLEQRLAGAGLDVETVAGYAPGEFGVQLPSGAAVSAAFSLAAARLTERKPVFELLPPKVTAWQQLAAKYSSGKLQRLSVAAGAALVVLAVLFGYQQWQLIRLSSHWTVIGPKVRELQALQAQVRQYRPWFDESYRALSILRALTVAFPEDGVVSAKTVEIRDPNVVSCSGVARDNSALLKTLERLRSSGGVADLKVDVIRGKSPMQFTFDFHWNEGGGNEP